MSEPSTSSALSTTCPARRDVILALFAAPGAAALASCSNNSKDKTAPADSTGQTTPTQPAASSQAPAATSGAATGKSQDSKAANDIKPGEAIMASVGGTAMIVTRTADGNYVGYPTVCTHEDGSLAPSGDKIRCSLHGGIFSLDGKPTSGPPKKPLAAQKLTKTADGFAKA